MLKEEELFIIWSLQHKSHQNLWIINLTKQMSLKTVTNLVDTISCSSTEGDSSSEERED